MGMLILSSMLLHRMLDRFMTLLEILVLRVRHWLWRVVLVGSVVSPASAVDIDIMAEFVPDRSRPQDNKFKDITPPYGMCAWKPNNCPGINSVHMRSYAMATRPIIANHSSERQGAMFRLPSQWRTISVYHEADGMPEILKFRMAGISGTYSTGPDLRRYFNDYSSTAEQLHERLWGGGNGWRNPPSPCGFLAEPARIDFLTHQFNWGMPIQSDGVCAKRASYDIISLQYYNLTMVYELEAPKPLDMRAGRYRGNLNFLMGPGQDIDFGDVVLPDTPNLNINFTLDVEHVFKVDIPPGGDRVELVPEGGWQSWLQNPAHAPKKLFRDQTFLISSSVPFSMQLICSDGYAEWCGIRNENNHHIPLAVHVSLPSGIVDGEGRPAVRQTLSNKRGVKFQPGIYVDNKPATLHFEAGRFVDEMLRDHAGSTYSGTVTVVWDSDV